MPCRRRQVKEFVALLKTIDVRSTDYIARLQRAATKVTKDTFGGNPNDEARMTNQTRSQHGPETEDQVTAKRKMQSAKCKLGGDVLHFELCSLPLAMIRLPSPVLICGICVICG